MLAALDEAALSAKRGEIPVGAVIVDPKTKTILSSSGNRTYELKDATAHAEIIIIRRATHIAGSLRINGFHMFVTLEPCPMCASAISYARLERLYIGAYDVKGGGVFHGPKIFDQPTCFHRPEIITGYHEQKSKKLLKNFFAQQRNSSKKLQKISHAR